MEDGFYFFYVITCIHRKGLRESRLSHRTYRRYLDDDTKLRQRVKKVMEVIVVLLKDRVEINDAPDSKRARTKKFVLKEDLCISVKMLCITDKVPIIVVLINFFLAKFGSGKYVIRFEYYMQCIKIISPRRSAHLEKNYC